MAPLFLRGVLSIVAPIQTKKKGIGKIRKKCESLECSGLI